MHVNALPGAPVTQPADLIPVPPEAAQLGAAFAAAGYELHLVGGTVRDALMGRTNPETVEDLDFATDARPEAVLDRRRPGRAGDLDDRHRVRHDRRPGRRPDV